MNKRKIDINQSKRITLKGKKAKSISVKYQTFLAYFKQKDSKDMTVFNTTFIPLITGLMNQLASAELIQKIENQNQENLKSLCTSGNIIKLESFELKGLSKQFPIQEICSCLLLQGQIKHCLSIIRPKLMLFYKHLRSIYPDFCNCAGEKLIVESSELKNLYEMFNATCSKNEEKGKLSALQRLERKVCRSLQFLGVIIENNIFDAIQRAQHKRKEEESDCGTKSLQKKNMKGVSQQVSTAYTISSIDPSNLSVRLKSETSKEQNFPNSRNNYSNYSQKSQKIISRFRFGLWEKAEIKQLKIKITVEQEEVVNEQSQKYQINYLSNDVENILIEQAFKIQKLFTANKMQKMGQYIMVDYSNTSYGTYQQPQYMGNYYMYYGNVPYQQPFVPSYLSYPDYSSDGNLNQLKRSLKCLNLVQTRKKDIDRYY